MVNQPCSHKGAKCVCHILSSLLAFLLPLISGRTLEQVWAFGPAVHIGPATPGQVPSVALIPIPVTHGRVEGRPHME